MQLYTLSLRRYLVEKTKEIAGFSGFCKGDIFLNPALKAGQDILREGRYEDHIIHAIRHFATRPGFESHYVDMTAGFGAIAVAVAADFTETTLYEANEDLRAVLAVNMKLKHETAKYTIAAERVLPRGKAVLRLEKVTDVVKDLGEAVIIVQTNAPQTITAPRHDVYCYSAGMDRRRPFQTIWRLLSRGYVFGLTLMDGAQEHAAGDYILVPKGSAAHFFN